MGENGGDYVFDGPLGKWLRDEKLRLRRARTDKSNEVRALFTRLAEEGSYILKFPPTLSTFIPFF